MSSIIKIVIGVVILGIAAGGISLGSKLWDPVWNPFRSSPEKIIEQMQTNMGAVKTFYSEGKIDIASREGASEFTMSMTFDNNSDISDPQYPKSNANFDITAAVEGMEFSIGMQTKVIGETYYLKLIKIPLPAQSLLSMFGTNINLIKNQWIKFDEETLKGLSGATPYMTQELSEKQEKAMIEKLQRIFIERPIYYIKEELPDEEIREKKAYHYLIALDKEEIKKIIPELLDIMIEFSLTPVVSVSEEEISNKIDELFENVGELSTEIWIGKKDKLIYKIKGEKEIDLNRFKGEKKGIVTGKLDIEFSNFDQPVEIKAPEYFKSLEEIFGQFQTPINNQFRMPINQIQ